MIADTAYAVRYVPAPQIRTTFDAEKYFLIFPFANGVTSEVKGR